MRKKRFTFQKLLLIVIVLALFIFSSYRPKPKVFEKEFPPLQRLGTTVQIKVVCKDEIAASHALNAAVSAIDNANLIYNSYSATSEISTAVEKAKIEPTEISAELYYILKKSLEYNKLTDGAFDITISNLSSLWKTAQKENIMPSTETILDVLNNKTGSKHIILTAADGYKSAMLEITNPDITLNVSAIAKGYITDLAAKAMKKLPDVYAGMVNIGGEIVCFNNENDAYPDNQSYYDSTDSYNNDIMPYNPEDNEYDRYADTPPEPSPYLDSIQEYQADTVYSEIKVFPIGITNPFAVENSLSPESHQWVVNLTNNAIATSGNYRQYFTIEGQRFSHIIDPKTGYPAHQASSATVIAPSCMQADALATSFSVMNPEEALALAESLPEVEAMIVYGTEDSPGVLKTSLFSEYMK